jgi:hypothetical protein
MSSAPRRSAPTAIKSGWKISVCQAIWIGNLFSLILTVLQKTLASRSKCQPHHSLLGDCGSERQANTILALPKLNILVQINIYAFSSF